VHEKDGHIQKCPTCHLDGLSHKITLELVIVKVVEWRRPPRARKVPTEVPIWKGGVTDQRNPVLLTLQHLRCGEEAGVVEMSTQESIGCADCAPGSVVARVGIIAESRGTFRLKPGPTVRGKIPKEKMAQAQSTRMVNRKKHTGVVEC
jgi:hypothetical protein